MFGAAVGSSARECIEHCCYLLQRMSPLLAQSRRNCRLGQRPLLREERTSIIRLMRSAFDPERDIGQDLHPEIGELLFSMRHPVV